MSNMLRVIIELFPKGDVSEGRVIAEGYIINNLEGTKEEGNYNYMLKLGGSGVQSILCTGKISKFKRKKDNVWKLLTTVLKKAKL